MKLTDLDESWCEHELVMPYRNQVDQVGWFCTECGTRFRVASTTRMLSKKEYKKELRKLRKDMKHV